MTDIQFNAPRQEDQKLLDARLAYWYPGIPDEFRCWSSEEKQAWLDAINQLQAEEILRFSDPDRLDHQRVYQLVLQATGDSQLAHKTKMQTYEKELIERTLQREETPPPLNCGS